MAADSNDFLHEIDELLSDTKENGDVPLSKNHDEGLLESINSIDVHEKEEENGLESFNPKIAEIRDALEKKESFDVLRQLCANSVPSEIRDEVWKSALEIRRRPNAIGTWEGPLDYENQTLIHKQCQEQAGKFPSAKDEDIQSVTSSLEQVITFYCKSRNISYKEDNGMAELLGPLVTLGFAKGDLFNSLYVILSKYIPRDCRAGGRPFDLFRLLLLYHDPELCSILDTRKLKPEVYLQQWLRSLFANDCTLPVLYCLWDQYFLERDPFLVFFLALVMVINAKELILETPPTTPLEEVVSMITSLPHQLTVEDIPDFVSLAQYYATRTPHSFRKDFHNLLFGNSRMLTTVTSGVLCLPVHMQEIFDSLSEEAAQQGLTYFIIDCRPLEHFSVGHLPKAIHLDTDLLLHSPQDFAVAMDRLSERVRQSKIEGGEHLCFLGSGREHEDQYMHMVVAKFLQQSTPYVSMARGGFIEMWRILGARAGQVFEDFDVDKCRALYEDYNGPIVVSSSTGAGSGADTPYSDGSDSEGFTAQYKQRIQQKSSQLYTSLSLGWRDKSQRLRVKFGQMWQSRQAAAYKDQPLPLTEAKAGRRYRNLPDVFVVGDEDETEEVEATNPLVNISLYSTSPDIVHSFPCDEVTSSNEAITSHLLLTASQMIVVREAPDRAGWGRVRHREYLSTILKITAKKKDMNCIIFRLGEVEDGEAVVNKVIKLRIVNSRKATNAVQELLGKENP